MDRSTYHTHTGHGSRTIFYLLIGFVFVWLVIGTAILNSHAAFEEAVVDGANQKRSVSAVKTTAPAVSDTIDRSGALGTVGSPTAPLTNYDRPWLVIR